MKKLLPFICLALLATFVFGQGRNTGAHGPHPGYTYHIPAMPMAQGEFQAAKNLINNKSFDSSKLQIANQVARGNYLSSRQVAELMQLFTFESTKLSFGKEAYSSVIDPGNYFMVYEAFTFDSSMDELAEFIGDQPVDNGDAYGYNSGANPGAGHGSQPHMNNIGINTGPTDDIYGFNSGAGSCEGPGNMAYMVSWSDFDMMKKSIDNQSFDSSKLTLAKQITSNNYLSSLQVKEVVELFCFESSKVKFAKFAFHHVADPNKYYVVNDAFTFSSSTSELDRYIAGL